MGRKNIEFEGVELRSSFHDNHLRCTYADLINFPLREERVSRTVVDENRSSVYQRFRT